MTNIGIFDSGLGGLTVYKEIKAHFPLHSFIYVGDLAYLPYGEKSADVIIKRSKKIVNFLLTKDIKSIIVACNSASSVALNTLKSIYDIPILGVINSSLSLAIKTTKTNSIGVIGTQTTIYSNAYQKGLVTQQKNINKNYKLVSVSCPLFVPLVEEGWHKNKEVVYEVAFKYLKTMYLQNPDIDTIILGCTHYPMLLEVLHDVLSNLGYKNLTFITNGDAIMYKINQDNIFKDAAIQQESLLNHQDKFYITDKSYNFQKLANNFLSNQINLEIVSL